MTKTYKTYACARSRVAILSRQPLVDSSYHYSFMALHMVSGIWFVSDSRDEFLRMINSGDDYFMFSIFCNGIKNSLSQLCAHFDVDINSVRMSHYG